MYHHVGVGEHPSTNVTVEQFEQHLAYLAENDYRVMALPEVVDAIRSGESLPTRTVAITFDDAYRSVYTEAFPRLRERGWPFTVFVNTGSVGGGSFMSWEQMREMGRTGVGFANHSHSHDYLIRRRSGEDESAWMTRISEDIQRAQAKMEEALPESVTTSPKLFAYPFGEYNRALADWLVDNGYIAFGQHSGALGVHTDWRAAPRFPVNERYAEMEGFARKVASMPLPVAAERPFDPVVSGRNPPELEVELTETPQRWRELRCYYGGDALEVEWLEEGRRFRVQASSVLPEGRSRYNCTVPVDGRFQWYSHLWIVP
jgi:peptidoglycan/xylan/chitin deacetylase (PgdA/CDA1 family)